MEKNLIIVSRTPRRAYFYPSLRGVCFSPSLRGVKRRSNLVQFIAHSQLLNWIAAQLRLQLLAKTMKSLREVCFSPSLRGVKRRSNPIPIITRCNWIASQSLNATVRNDAVGIAWWHHVSGLDFRELLVSWVTCAMLNPESEGAAWIGRGLLLGSRASGVLPLSA